MPKPKLTLKKNKEFSLIKGHPWAYADAFQTRPASLRTGDLAEVYSHRDKYIGTGFIDTDSQILLRMLPIQRQETFSQGVSRLVKEAISYRLEHFRSEETNAFRLINGEGDGLPGLIVDRYDRAVCMQIYSLGLQTQINTIAEAIKEMLPQTKWLWRRNQIRLAKTQAADLVFGRHMPEKIEFKENGLNYSTDLVNGQKTGFFLDQRDNRQLIRSISQGKSFLNICGYTGAFTVAAVAGGAINSVTVDIAKPALVEAERNLALNGIKGPMHKLVGADMYDYLNDCKSKSFDLVVLDPPSMAKNRRDAEKAVRAYKKLNQTGVKVVKEGGYLFTASCTSQVGREEFSEAVRDAIAASGRRAIIVHESFHTKDHPIALAHPEGRYLKGLLLKVY